MKFEATSIKAFVQLYLLISNFQIHAEKKKFSLVAWLRLGTALTNHRLHIMSKHPTGFVTYVKSNKMLNISYYNAIQKTYLLF